MSANSHSYSALSHAPSVLGELLHSISQPLTTLRCSLELSLSIDEKAAPQPDTVSIALQQTERIIGMIQLMREYVEAEQPRTEGDSASIAATVWGLTEELRSIAAVRGIRLLLTGTCTATLPLPEPRLRLALQYLIASLLEAQADGGKVTLLLGEGPAGTVLRAEGDGKFFAATALRTARQAIARRVLETAGASLVLANCPANGFVLRIPPPKL
jgi:signal transduction histidine kinase